MMDASYQPIYKQAAALQHQFHDYTHTKAYDPQATVLRNEIHKLTNDLAANKNPRRIESRLKVIQKQLKYTQQMQDHPSSVFGMPGVNPGVSGVGGMHGAMPYTPGAVADLASHPGVMPSTSPILNVKQSSMLNHNFEMMRRNVRQMPHY